MKQNGAIMKTIDIKGKEYVTVNERIKYFRENFEGYAMPTEIIRLEDGVCVMKASIINPNNQVVATGHAYEKENSTFINKTSYIENCETSAWGRALANFGIGIDSNVASADEVANAIKQQELTAEPIDPKYNFAKEETIKDDDIEDKLKSYRSLQSVVNLWKKLTKDQQEDWRDRFAIKRQQLKDDGIYA